MEIKNENLQITFDLFNFNDIFKLISVGDEETIKKNIIEHLKKLISNSTYAVLFLFRSSGAIDDYDSDQIYNRLPTENSKNIMLIVNSSGGKIEPAYLISKCCKEKSQEKFIVCIPRRAKSAATLISLGADEIHMGSLSQIGPIDPQFNELPALSLSSALECLALLCKKYPESSVMFAEYLAKTLPINVLGYFERISESAKHYAIRLLQNKNFLHNKPDDIANKLVYEYKDHSFVIEKEEATNLFGSDFVKVNTQEYSIGNNVYSFLEQINFLSKLFRKKSFNLIGSVEDLITIPE